jgi:type VI secretion system protein ImpM
VSEIETVPGWYGKLPTLGDFASRRLGPEFIEPWDLWLGDGLAAQREALGDGWLDAYLQSPVWRFVLMPEVLQAAAPKRALAGVLMPSVDRVGRYFPLTLVAALPRVPRRAAEIEQLLGWLHQLEDLAADAMHDDWSVEQLEDELARCPKPLEPVTRWPEHLSATRESLASALQEDAGFVSLGEVKSRAELAALWSASLASGDAEPPAPTPGPALGRSFWLSDNPQAPQMLVARGLPARDAFIRMLGATGRDAGATTTF